MLLEVFTEKRPIDTMFIGDPSIKQWVQLRRLSMLWTPAPARCFSASYDLKDLIATMFQLGLIWSSESPDQRMAMSEAVVTLRNMPNNQHQGSPTTVTRIVFITFNMLPCRTICWSGNAIEEERGKDQETRSYARNGFSHKAQRLRNYMKPIVGRRGLVGREERLLEESIL